MPRDRKKYLHHISLDDEIPIQVKTGSPQVVVREDTTRIVVSYMSSSIEASVFKSVLCNPHQAARKWLRFRASTDMLDVCGRPSCREEDGGSHMQVIARVPSKSVRACLEASGIDGVWTRQFIEEGKEHLQTRVVRMEEDADLQGALRQAVRIDGHLGVVKTRDGYGIRVEASDFEPTVKLLCPSKSERILAKKFAVSGLPVSCGRDALAELLLGWNHEALFTYTTNRSRTWVVAAAEAPIRIRFQHQDGTALVQEHQPRAQQRRSAQPRTWMLPTPSTRDVDWPKAWSSNKEQIAPGGQAPPSSISQPAVSSPKPRPAPISSQSEMSSMIASAMAQALRPLEERIKAMERDKNRKRDFSCEDDGPRGRPRILGAK